MTRLAALAFFVLLAIAHTWPLARRPSVYSRVDNGDYNLNVWAIDWVAHTLPTDPGNLFNANIFHPEPLTLAYSEPLIAQGVLAIPSVWTGASPVATYTIVLLAGFALSGWAFALLAHRATGSWPAGLLAGSAVAFNSHTLVRLAHIQALHLELVPLVFLALDSLLLTGRIRHAAVLGAALAVQVTQSIYLLVFTGWAALCAWMARLPEWRHRLGATLAWASVAAVACALLLLPVIWPYAELARRHGMMREIGETQGCAATWMDFLYTGSRLHYDAWASRFDNASDANFPGVTVTLLAVVALLGGGWGRPRTRMWLGVALGSVLLSLLPWLPGFAWLQAHVPPLAAIRCYSRAGQMMLVGMGMLAGLGAARVLERLPSARTAAMVGGLLVLTVNLEALRAPLGYREFEGVPAIYDRLRSEPRAVVVEMPFYERGAFYGNAEYMVYATRHHHPMVNGYSGFTPPDYDATAGALRTFPGYPALELMHRLGVTHVVVHWTRAMEDRRGAIDGSPSLRLWIEAGDIAIYRFVSR